FRGCRRRCTARTAGWVDAASSSGGPSARPWPLRRLCMRASVLAVVTLLSAPACTRDPASAPAASGGADKAPGPALQVPSVPQVSRWELDPENSSAAFVCKHVFSNVRGMFQQPAGTLVLDDATPA